ncbi:MAG: DEAD/DEAH box helicase, partial [Chloroflexi bacterium]|nr:DEAD/DEAH box helicase [Chloroflexota bacterium]
MKSILHGTWVCDRDGRTDGLFFVWAERDVRVAPAAGARSARVVRHPYAATTIEIADLLSRYVPKTDWRRASRLVRVAFLPSVAQGPLLPRWVLPDDQEPSEGEPHLQAWRIEGIGIPLLEMLGVLAVLPAGDEERLTGQRVGDDLTYWGLVAKLALELLGRQRFLPGLRSDNGDYAASWMPYLEDPADQARFAALTRGMPPVCRAVLHERQAPTPDDAPSPYTALSSFVHRLIDEAVREWAQASPRAAELGLRPRTTRLRPSRVGTAWWQALYSSDRTVSVPTSKQPELARFYQAWQNWTYHARPESDIDFRLCFQLEPPDYENGAAGEEAHQWTLRYLLQSLEDPSLLVAASEVWRERGRLLSTLDARLDRAQEILLAGLGRAARLSPAIQRSLRTASPEGTTLSAKEAYRFLRETSRLLEEMGFGVMVPPWWNKPDARLSVRARLHGRPEVETEGMLSMNTLIAYDWELALGDETLTQEEFERLAELKTPLVKVRGRWVLLQPEQVEAAIAFWERQRNRSRLPLNEALGLALGVENEIDGLTVSGLEVQGWLGELLAALDGKEQMERVEAPEAFVGELRPYQLRGLSWLAFLRKWGLGACLADDMGLGKTIQAIALLLHEREQTVENGVQPTLVVCPTSLVGNWAREVQRFAPDLRVMVHHGAGRAEGSDLLDRSLGHDVVISTYGLVRRDIEDLGHIPWANVIL